MWEKKAVCKAFENFFPKDQFFVLRKLSIRGAKFPHKIFNILPNHFKKHLLGQNNQDNVLSTNNKSHGFNYDSRVTVITRLCSVFRSANNCFSRYSRIPWIRLEMHLDQTLSQTLLILTSWIVNRFASLSRNLFQKVQMASFQISSPQSL